MYLYVQKNNVSSQKNRTYRALLLIIIINFYDVRALLTACF